MRLEVILRRLAEFMERSESLKKKVQGAMIYPIIVILVAVGILTFIMIKIVPVFAKMFDEFELKLPACDGDAGEHLQLLGDVLVPDPVDPHRRSGSSSN